MGCVGCSASPMLGRPSPSYHPDEPDGAHRAAAAFLPPLSPLRCPQQLGVTRRKPNPQPVMSSSNIPYEATETS